MSGGRRRRQMAQAAPNQIAFHQQQISFSGPLPPPNILARYNEVVPDAAERILRMAENQATHRQAIERKVVEGNVTAQALGVKLGAILAGLVIVGGSTVSIMGRDIRGFGGALLAGGFLVANSIYQRRRQEKERKENAQAFGELPPAPGTG
jgi:uncharacterized membrane protein